MRVLVTGGAGFIGSNLTHALVAAGHEVGIVDDLSTGKRENLHPYAWLRTMDILDPGFAGALAEFGPEAVVHLAAQASVTESVKNPQRDWAVNAEGTRIVARAARMAGVRRVLSVSSAAVYGEPQPSDLPLLETAPKAPANPYGESKLAAEQMLADELEGTGVDFASLRFSNVYGPRQDGAGEGGVVAIFCTRLRNGEAPIVYGDGNQTRDFIYVGDVVGAIVKALSSDRPLAHDGTNGPAYNISTGLETSVNDIVAALRVASGYFGPAISAPARAGDVARSSLSPDKARSELGWEAGGTLEEGMAMTWGWFASQQ